MGKLVENNRLILHLEPADIIVREGLERYRKDLGSLEDLADSIKRLGQLQPILITDEYELVAGGRRLAACIHGGIRVKALFQENVTDVLLREMELEENIQRKALTPAEEALAIAEIHKLRQEQHGKAIQGKKDSGWTLEQTAEMTGMSKGNVIESIAIAQLLEQFPSLTECKTKKEIKKTAEVLTKTIERMANLTAHEELVKESGIPCEMFNVDALEHMKSVPDESVDLLMADPPFGIDIDKNAIGLGGVTGGETTAGFKFDDSRGSFLEVIAVLATESYRFVRSNGHGYIFVARENFPLVRELFMAAGWLAYVRPIIWIKRESGQNNAPHCWPSAAYEFILFVRKAESKLLAQGKPDWIQCEPVLASQKIHPTEKPVNLIEQLITRSTDIGQLLYDPFMGSGSSLEAGLNMRLRVLGCEILEEAYASAQDRIARWSKYQQEMKDRINGIH